MDSNFKKLKECNTGAKLAMKQWQEDYKEEYGFTPNKDAFQQAPNEVRDAYKIYWKTSKQLSVLKNHVELSLGNIDHLGQNLGDLTKSKEPTVNREKLSHSNNANTHNNISEPRADSIHSLTYQNLQIDNSNLKVEGSQFQVCNNSGMDDSKLEISQTSEAECLKSQIDNHNAQINIFSSKIDSNSEINISNSKSSSSGSENQNSNLNNDTHSVGVANKLNLEINTQNNSINVDNKQASKVSKDIWGHHLNKRKSVYNDSSNEEFSLYNKMAENMKGRGVVKTRLSLKRVSCKSLCEKKNKNLNVTVCSDKVTHTQEIHNSDDITNCNSNNFENGLFASKINNIPDEEISTSTKLICNVTKSTPKIYSQAVSYLSLNSTVPKKARKLNNAWVRRCSSIVQDSISIQENTKDLSVEAVSNSTIGYNDNIGPNETQICSSQAEVIPDLNLLKRKYDSSELTSNSSKRLKMDSENIQEVVHKSNTVNVVCDESKVLKSTNEPGLCDVKINSTIESEKESRSPKSKPIKAPLNSNTTNVISPEPVSETTRLEKKVRKTHNDKVIPKMTNNENEQKENSNTKPSGKQYISKENRLEHKMLSGKINENFVKINLKKKIFVRGKKRMRAEIYKRQEWKKKQALKNSDKGGKVSTPKSSKCFKCEGFGHWARECQGQSGDNLLPVNDYNEKESTFLTLNEASDLAKGVSVHTNKENGIQTQTVKVMEIQSDTNKKVKGIEVRINRASNKNNDEGELSPTNSEDEIFSDWDEDVVAMATEMVEPKTSECEQNFINNTSCDKARKNTSFVRPLYEVNSEGNTISTPLEVIETLKLFGYNSFRRGQEEAIMRILSGESTLLVQSTGSGKSLCYQLPAYLYSKHFGSITICVSPLVSLMEDQVTGLPSFLKAICVHTQQTTKNREKALNALRSGNVHILLVSPEAIVMSSNGGIFKSLLKELPPVAFACLDEAHCLSEWSHNFRPSYLQVCKILREKLHVNTFLGLTATARNDTAVSIAKHLQVSCLNQGLIKGTCIPQNLKLSISRDANKEVSLMHLLTGNRFEGCSSIIIYCTRRAECERIATFIRTQVVVASKINVKENAKRRRGISLDAEAYHAGLSGFRRQQIQTRFMSGKLRIVVATVAFGMGIDKADVQGIIHFNMPRNLESYVQEIGRAGRDGNIAHCHLFLDSLDGKDIQELKRHIFVNSVDRHIVRKLLGKVFVPHTCKEVNKLVYPICTSNSENGIEGNQDMAKEASGTNEPHLGRITCPGHEVAIPIEDLVELLDLPEENIQTLLCYLEMDPGGKLKLSQNVYATCKLSCYGGPKQLCAVSRKCPPLAAAIALQQKQGKKFDGVSSLTFPVVDISSQMGWQSGIVKQELKNLEWNSSAGGVKQSGVKVEFCDLAFRLTCRCDLSEEEQDRMLESIYERACRQEKDQLRQLQYTYTVLRQSSSAAILLCCDVVDEDKSSVLKAAVEEYFEAREGDGGSRFSALALEEQLYLRPDAERHIRGDIRSLLSIHSDQTWTGRAVARVLHGISSPNFPSKVWGRVRKFWRLHLQTDFNLLVGIATNEILKFR